MKSVMKWFGIIVIVMAIGFSILSCGFEDTDKTNGNSGGNDGGSSTGKNPTINIKNNTGYTITWGYIKPSTEAKDWGSAIIGMWYSSYGSLADGSSGEFTLSEPLSVHNKYDIQLSGGGYKFIKYGVTVSNKMTITFTTNDINDGSTLPTITIQNRSGKSFDSIHIKPSVSSDWSESFGSVSNNSDSTANILIPASNYTVFDIQMKSTNPTNTYTKNEVTITNGMKLIFTSADMDNPTIELPVIVIENKTGYTIGYHVYGMNEWVYIWIKPSTEAEWGEELRGRSGIENGTSRAFTLSQHLSVNRVYDIKITAGGYTFIKYNVTVSEGMIVTFTTNDLEN